MGALAWEQEPPKTHSVSRSFFDRGVGSSILASLSEAGGNDPHKSQSKPLPPRSKTREDRLSECASVSLLCTPRSNPRRFAAPGIPCVCSGSSRTSSQNCVRFRLRGLIWESRLPPRECPSDFPDAFCGMRPNRIPLLRLNQRVKSFARPDSENFKVKEMARRTPSPLRSRIDFPELSAAAFREPRRLDQAAIEDVMSGKFLCVGKEGHYSVAAAFGRPNGAVRR
jgi:hypothetical protein